MKLPFLEYNSWAPTRITIHLIMQMMGKIKLKLTPPKNYWWNMTLFVYDQGFTTRDIPFNNGLDQFCINLNVTKNRLEVVACTGYKKMLLLEDGVAIQDVHGFLSEALNDLGQAMKPHDTPYDMGITTPFQEITEHSTYDFEAIDKFWKMYMWVNHVLNIYAGKSYVQTSPVQIFWHHLDMAVSRYSYKRILEAETYPTGADRESYSHEVVSVGFWAGDDNVQYPAFYAYAAPAPKGLAEQPLEPLSAQWVDSNGSPMALLAYEDLLSSEDPVKDAVAFCQSAYVAGAKLCGWDVVELEKFN